MAYRYPGVDGKPRDWRKAVYWLAKSGRQKEGGAMMVLAEMFQSGVGVERNWAQAAQLLRAGRRIGHRGCRFFYARMLLYGIGVKQDRAQAIADLQELSWMGFTGAAYELALIYLEGRGGQEPSGSEAKRYLSYAAVWGNAEAQLKLGQLYLQGGFPLPNRQEAYRWIYKAAKEGLAPARRLLQLLDMTMPAEERETFFSVLDAAEEGFLCGTGILSAIDEDEKKRANDRSPHPFIDWDELVKLADTGDMI